MIFGAVTICTSVQGFKERVIGGSDFKRHDWRGSFPSAQHLREHPTSPNRNVKSQVFVVPAS